MRRKRHIVLAFLLILSLATACRAESIVGRCIRVADGDTIAILTPAKRQVKVRLACIDCPERRQPFGKRAKQFTSSLVFARMVRVEVVDRDRYGRVIGWVYVVGPRGKELCVNEELIKAGLAWVYRKYCRNQRLLALEREAKKDRRGLWGDPHPVPPWMFRARRRY